MEFVGRDEAERFLVKFLVDVLPPPLMADDRDKKRLRAGRRCRGIDSHREFGPSEDQRQDKGRKRRRGRPGNLDRHAAVDLGRLGSFAGATPEANDVVDENAFHDQENHAGDRQNQDEQRSDGLCGRRGRIEDRHTGSRVRFACPDKKSTHLDHFLPRALPGGPTALNLVAALQLENENITQQATSSIFNKRDRRTQGRQ